MSGMHKGLHHTTALHPLWEPMRLLSLSPHYKKEAEVGKLAQGEQLTYGSCKFRCKSSLVWLQNPLLPNEMKMKGSRSVVSDSLWPHGLQPTGSSVHGIFQTRILEWVAISFSKRSSWLKGWTQVSRIAGKRFTVWATREVVFYNSQNTQQLANCLFQYQPLGVLSRETISYSVWCSLWCLLWGLTQKQKLKGPFYDYRKDSLGEKGGMWSWSCDFEQRQSSPTESPTGSKLDCASGPAVPQPYSVIIFTSELLSCFYPSSHSLP